MEGQLETKWYKVIYPRSNSHRRLSILDILKPDLLEMLLTTKSYQWRYEKEWRIFCNTGGDRTYRFNSKAITGVYFGYKMPKEYKNVIISIFSDSSKQNNTYNLPTIAKNYRHTLITGTQIIPYDMRLNKIEFNVTPCPFRL